jgi:methylmalonyl-CoA/ethylmalonyl-CoA epimerase
MSAETPAPGLVFHHVGVACRSIDAELREFAALGYVVEGPRFVDPLQGIRGQFVCGAAPRLELLEALDEEGGVLAPWMRSGIKLYHLAYETEALATSIVTMRAEGAKLVVEPVPAVAFAGREIAFLMLRNRMLVELIARA